MTRRPRRNTSPSPFTLLHGGISQDKEATNPGFTSFQSSLTQGRALSTAKEHAANSTARALEIAKQADTGEAAIERAKRIGAAATQHTEPASSPPVNTVPPIVDGLATVTYLFPGHHQ